ncbi:hypothetical protein QC762_0023980 [Podospora pseudocomata]|nr:hypothetical protein QC762_0023980 [Podospora pseudocomata]KAK4674736.1 hypothetical protein QC763_0027420 [Podospora pseudopauciseta]KAK4683229.1 hypothetical protein QC764_0027320 [Podospora pseudoanserina]
MPKNMCRQLFLLRKSKQPVALDTQNKSRLLNQSQRLGNGRGAVAAHVVGVQLAGHGDVTVAVEALDELLSLVAEVRLRGKLSLAGP